MLDLVYRLNPWIIPAILLCLIIAGTELGFRMGRRRPPGIGEEQRSQISVVEAALIGVLGLLLAFTLSMAVSRFELRKQLVLEEANAIETAHLRTALLQAPQNAELADLLCRYVDTRVRFGVSTSPQAINAARQEAQQLQASFWAKAVDYAKRNPNPVTAGLLIQSLNDVIDLDAARWRAFNDHVPSAVIYLNGIVSLLTMGLVGYAFGVDRLHHGPSMRVLSVAIAVVLGVIIDLDRPRHGFIATSQQPMIELQQQLQPHR
jgi:hypothetical protein